MGSPLETIFLLHQLPEPERSARAAEGADAWEALGNPEQALARAPTEARRLRWEAERERQRARLEANARAAGRRRFPPALPSLAWDEAGDLARGVTWIRRDGRTDLLDLSGAAPRMIPLSASPEVLDGIRRLGQSARPLLLVPSGSAEILNLALASQPEIFLTMRAPLLVVEPRVGVLRMLARLFDLEGPLGEDHVLWFTGPDWEGRMASLLRSYPGIPLPQLKAVLGAQPEAERSEALLKEAQDWREAEAARLEAEAERIHAARPPADLAAAFAEGASPRVLLVTSRFTTVLQYAIRDLEQAFRSLGCPTCVVIEPRDCAWSVTLEMRQKCVSFRPDLVVQIDHLRSEFGRALHPAIPYACWIQDRLPNLLDPRWISGIGKRDLTFSMWPGMTRDCLAAGYPEVLPLPVAGNALVYRPPDRAPAPGADVAFVSNLSAPAPHPRYPGLVQRAEELLRSGGIGYRDPAFYASLLARLESELSLRVHPEDREGVLRLLSFDVERFVQRSEPLRWARDMGLRVAVYGRGWEASPEFAPVARGAVAPGEALRDLYASVPIHLHMNSDTNVHARVFECLLSGGFVLAWAHPGDGAPGGLGEMLEIGREIAVFDGREDFEAKVRRFLDDADARRAVSEAGRARVLEEHTTVHRAREILRRVRERLERA